MVVYTFDSSTWEAEAGTGGSLWVLGQPRLHREAYLKTKQEKIPPILVTVPTRLIQPFSVTGGCTWGHFGSLQVVKLLSWLAANRSLNRTENQGPHPPRTASLTMWTDLNSITTLCTMRIIENYGLTVNEHMPRLERLLVCSVFIVLKQNRPYWPVTEVQSRLSFSSSSWLSP